MKYIDDIAIAYVSLMIPDDPKFWNAAVHRNGNTFMQNVFFGLNRILGACVTSFSAIPIPSFPRSNRLFIAAEKLQISPDTFTTTVPFINVTPLKQLAIGLFMFWSLLKWGLRGRQSRYKVVFSYNISVPPLLFTLAAARLLGTKVLLFIGDVNIPGETVPDTLFYRIDARLQTGLLRYVAGSVVVSDRIAIDLLPGRPYIRLDGGADGSLIEATGRFQKEDRATDGHFTIAATGYLSEFNGFHELLSAFSNLKGPKYQLVIAGGGPLQETITNRAAIDPRIQFRGFLSYDELLELHSRADVLVSMRLTKKMNTAYAFPSKTFEYLLSGVPVITTASGHMASEYGPYCFILDEESSEALTAKLLLIENLGAPERARVAASARKYIMDSKTWSKQQARIAEFVYEVVTKGEARA